MFGWCWHKWGKWTAYTVNFLNHGNSIWQFVPPLECSEERQRRTCEKCGKTQDEVLR